MQNYFKIKRGSEPFENIMFGNMDISKFYNVGQCVLQEVVDILEVENWESNILNF